MKETMAWGIKTEFKNVLANPIDVLKNKGTSDEIVAKYIQRVKKEETVDYFRLYMRYLKQVKVSYKKSSIEGKMLSILNEGVYKNGFITCETSETKTKIEARMSLLDFIKLTLIIKIKKQFSFEDKILQFIFLTLRYSINVMPSEKQKISANSFWWMHDETMDKLWEYGFNDKISVDRIPELNEIYEELEKSGIYAVVKFAENRNFEDALFYALNYRKSVYLAVNIRHSLMPISYFINGSDVMSLDDGIHINLLRLLQYFDGVPGKKGLANEIVYEEVEAYFNSKDRAKKEKYIDGIYDKISEMYASHTAYHKKEREKLKKLSMDADKANIELTFGYFDIPKNNDDTETNRIEDVEKFLQLGVNGHYLLEVANGVVKSSKNDFSTSELTDEMYEELKEYTEGYGHVTSDYNNYRPTRFVGEKRTLYGKKKQND